MWWDPDELGEWALLKIINISRPYKSINKIKKYKKIILNIKDDLIRSKWCYKYCDKVEDDIEMMRGITHPYWAEGYSINIRSDPYIDEIVYKDDLDYNYTMGYISHKFREMVEQRNMFKRSWISKNFRKKHSIED